MAKDPVIAALAQQVQCYQRLAKLTAIQHEHVQNSRTEDLLAVLAQRQNLLDQVADLEQCIGPSKKRWGAFLGELPEDDRTLAASMMDQTLELLEEITTADRRDALALQQRKMHLGREINQAQAARQFNRNYAAAAYGRRPSTAVNVVR